MNKYSYDGPVMVFDICVQNRWRGETMAESEDKARSNLTYQFKKNNKKLKTSNGGLPGKITIVDGGN